MQLKKLLDGRDAAKAEFETAKQDAITHLASREIVGAFSIAQDNHLQRLVKHATRRLVDVIIVEALLEKTHLLQLADEGPDV